MTADELRRLSEIAGLKLSAVGELLQSGSRFYRPNKGKYYTNIPVYDWQPHLRIEQAMMVADSFPQWKVGKYKFENMQIIYECIFTIEDEELYEQAETPALAICNAALAAAKEDK